MDVTPGTARAAVRTAEGETWYGAAWRRMRAVERTVNGRQHTNIDDGKIEHIPNGTVPKQIRTEMKRETAGSR